PHPPRNKLEPAPDDEIGIIERGSSDYPEALLDLPSPPAQLYLLGDGKMLERPMIAIVGTRDATPYGLRTARTIASALSRAGVTIVSGLARGIDSAVHHAALEHPAGTVAVMGTGVDVPYPVGHRELHRAIAASGLVVSENGSGKAATQGAFPRRNRIIAALARATIVIEAGHRSGALNTATHAMNIDRPVAAVPGPIDSPQSAGANQLIRDGAIVIASVEDALALAGVQAVSQPEPIQLPEVEARVWAALGGAVHRMDSLAAASGLTARECMGVITSLELRGMVECLVSGEIRRR
ncbi:MAG TPA: DNA-processing protein DprA, partial [Gemmatimonadaceae bacterium]|nr:DNA-processing protein DprA [Gemmatimonadaceae bacterium]